MKLIVGLGNPGKEYVATRHNIGCDVLSFLFDQWKKEKKLKGEISISPNMIGLFPTTFMNLSGEAVLATANFYNISTQDIIVIHDDIDIPLADVRIKKAGGHGGHRGVKSIIECLQSPDFTRIKCGVGRPQGEESVIEHVLSQFNDDEKSIVQEMSKNAASVILTLCKKDEPGSSSEEKDDT